MGAIVGTLGTVANNRFSAPRTGTTVNFNGSTAIADLAARTDQPRLGPHELPLYRSAVTISADALGQASAVLEVEAADEPEALRAGLVRVPPSTRMTVRGPMRGEYALTTTMVLDTAGLAALQGQPTGKAA